jgi:hypothetical protein
MTVISCRRLFMVHPGALAVFEDKDGVEEEEVEKQEE